MAAVYFDTSALVRRYDDTEPGAQRVRDLCHARAGNFLLIAPFASVEMASALNRKAREGSLTAPERDRAWSLFRHHRRLRYRSVGADGDTYRRAERLLFRHPLRTIDTVDVAAALVVRHWLASTIADFLFCTADQNQATAAEREGLDVELIA